MFLKIMHSEKGKISSKQTSFKFKTKHNALYFQTPANYRAVQLFLRNISKAGRLKQFLRATTTGRHFVET